MAHGGLQYIRYLYMVVDMPCDGGTLQSQFPGLDEEALHLTVEAVAHQFEGDIGVAIDAGRLSLSGEKPEDLADVGHVEVTTQTEVLGAPVVPPEEGMHILQAALACCGIAQMAQEQLGTEDGGRRMGRSAIVGDEASLYTLEDLGDGTLALGTLTEHIFLASRGMQTDTGHASPFLSTVVLFLHHEVELVQPITLRAILCLVIALRLQQANHRHTTLMLQLFHRCKLE